MLVSILHPFDMIFSTGSMSLNSNCSQHVDARIDAEFDEESESDFPAHVATFLVEIEGKMYTNLFMTQTGTFVPISQQAM